MNYLSICEVLSEILRYIRFNFTAVENSNDFERTLDANNDNRYCHLKTFILFFTGLLPRYDDILFFVRYFREI